MLALTKVHRIFRKSLILYTFTRRFAPFFCRFLILEDGFEVLKFIDNNRVFDRSLVDVGSNDGTSIRMMRQFFKKNRIYAFDPIVNLPVRDKSISFFNVALGSKNGILEIYTPIVKNKLFTQYSSSTKEFAIKSVQKDFDIELHDNSIEKFQVRTIILDSMHLKPFFIKIDIEGAELSVLQGAIKTVKKYSPIILLEISSHKLFIEVSNFMLDLEYFLFTKINVSYDSNRNNYVFIKKDSFNYFHSHF